MDSQRARVREPFRPLRAPDVRLGERDDDDLGEWRGPVADINGLRGEKCRCRQLPGDLALVGPGWWPPAVECVPGGSGLGCRPRRTCSRIRRLAREKALEHSDFSVQGDWRSSSSIILAAVRRALAPLSGEHMFAVGAGGAAVGIRYSTPCRLSRVPCSVSVRWPAVVGGGGRWHQLPLLARSDRRLAAAMVVLADPATLPYT